MGWPILSPGKKLTGGKFLPVTPVWVGRSVRIFFFYSSNWIPIKLNCIRGVKNLRVKCYAGRVQF